MNIPNSLTILRILLIPCYIGLLIYGRFDQALIVLLVAGLTDALDGAIARMKNQHTRLGAVLDPLADKLLLTSGFITLSLIHLIPLWVTILVVSRDVILMLGTAVAHFTDYSRGSYPHLLGQGHDVSPAGLCRDGHLSQFPSASISPSSCLSCSAWSPSRCYPGCIISTEAIRHTSAISS